MFINTSTNVHRQLERSKNLKKAKQSLIWGSFNIVMLSVLLYDLANSCPLHITYIQYIEYTLIVILVLNTLYHFSRFFVLSHKLEVDKMIAAQNIDCSKLDSSNVSKPATPSFVPIRMSLTSPNSSSLSATPMNMTALSWNSNLSTPANNSLNLSNFYNPSPKNSSYSFSGAKSTSLKSSPFVLPPNDMSGSDIISDEDSLVQYLNDYETYEKVHSLASNYDRTTNLLSSFWTHPAAKTNNEASFLKRGMYQLSTPSPTSSSNSSPSTKPEGRNAQAQVQVQGMEMWRRLGVDTTILTLWTENLRVWISKTILERLVQEFDYINSELQKHGFGDISVGGVGLDRLRKTAQLSLVSQHIPSLPALIQFLEITTNQEYLVRRIRDLEKGGCMSEFKWNGGGSYNEKEWDPSLPTDSAIVMHLFATYLDTQLMPLPNKPDAKPFSSCHYIKMTDPLPQLTPNTLAIHQVNEKPPLYRVIVGQEVYELQGYNNLFNSILFFLYHVNKREHGMLGQVNLGKAGVNMLWIIQT